MSILQNLFLFILLMDLQKSVKCQDKDFSLRQITFELLRNTKKWLQDSSFREKLYVTLVSLSVLLIIQKVRSSVK